jgi:hypothetical protein
MSYDLAVWHEGKTITAVEAQAKYEQLCGGEKLERDHAVRDFVSKLTKNYPQIDDFDEDDLDDCPWSCEFDQSPGHCILNLRWDAVDELVPVIISIAKTSGLVCYDPQQGELHIP